ncbi:MAG: hypothetical protein HWE33_04105 [Rhodobacteraceae bacterium]|nr:hypothetical protein [Paracoccaceae bacterium]
MANGNQIISSAETGHSVSVDGMPKEAWEAIIRKLNQRGVSVTKTFASSYQTQLEDIRELLRKVDEQFEGINKIDRTCNVSLILKNNQRHDFGDWNEFESFDHKTPERTRSINVELTYDVWRETKQEPERYSIEVAIQNQPAELGFRLGPLNMVRASSFALPPVPIACKVEGSSYVLSQNLISRIEQWENGLRKQNNFFVDKLRPQSHKVREVASFLGSFSFLGIAYAVRPNAPTSTIPDLAEWILVSVSALAIFYGLATVLSRGIERNIDRHQSLNNFIMTKGDRNQDEKVSKNNQSLTIKSLVYLTSIVIQILIGIGSGIILQKM